MPTTIGTNVRHLRTRAGYVHQGLFAERAGISQQWLSDLEGGRIANPAIDNLIKVAVAIPCAFDDLLHGVSEDFDETRAALRGERADAGAEAMVRRIRRLPNLLREHLRQQLGLLELIELQPPPASSAPGAASAPTRAGSRRKTKRRRARGQLSL